MQCGRPELAQCCLDLAARMGPLTGDHRSRISEPGRWSARPSLTQMYGPAVRRKRFSSICRLAVLHQCIRPLIGACCAPGHHGYQRACGLITGQASNGPFGSPGFAGAGKTGPPSRFILSQTSAGKRGLCHRSLPDRCSSFVRAVRPFLRPGLQVVRGIARRDRQGWPSQLPLFLLQRLQATR